MERPTSNGLFENPEETTRQLYKNWREGFALPLLIGVLIFGAIALIPAVIASQSTLVRTAFITSYLLTVVVTLIRFPYMTRMSVFLLGIYVLGISELLTHGILGDSLFFFLALIVFSTILLSPRAGISVLVLDTITFVIFGWLMLGGQVTPLNPNASPAKIEDWVSASAAMAMFGIVIILGFQRLEKEFIGAQKQVDSTLKALTQERGNLELKVQERTDQLRKINEIERAVTSILDPEELLPQAVRHIESKFKCYYTAFHLLDVTGQWAELQEASGEAGKVLKENKHRADINGKSAISQAIRTKIVQIAPEKPGEKVSLDNPLLPYTRSKIVLPLIVGDNAIGALEMHSTNENEFSLLNADAYQTMANGIAIAIENSRLFREAQQNLLEMQATQRQYLLGAWQSLISEQDLEYAIGDSEPADADKLQIPLALRGQTIGQIHMENSGEWTTEQKNLIEAIAAQATLALENARLVEESQSAAAQERLANDIIAKIWASANMDSILQTAARELGRSLEATEVEIELSMEGKDVK